MMISEPLMIFWLVMINILAALFVIALAAYITGYYWTLGRHRALLAAFQDRQKKSTEVTKHDTQKQ